MTPPMSNLMPFGLAYAILTPVAITLLLLFSTYIFTNARYQARLWLSQKAAGKPRTPNKIPYALPFLGSAFSFLHPSVGSFWSQLFKWHSRATAACTLKMGGRSMHILYDPHAIQALFKARDPTRDNFNLDIVCKGFGMELEQAKRYYALNDGPSEKLGGVTPKHEQERIWNETLLRTDRVNELTAKFMEVLRDEMSSEVQGEGETMEMGLYSFVRKYMFRASTIAFLGATCLADYPELEPDFFKFEANFLTCYFGIPRWLSPEPYAVRDRITQGLVQWKQRDFERTKGKVIDPNGDVAWEPIQGSRANRARQIYYEARDLNIRTQALMDLGFLFGVASNAIPAAGWILMHIFNLDGDKTLYPRVMDEIRASTRPDGSLNVSLLVGQPLLLSMLHEVLRLYNDTLVTRELPKDIVLPVGTSSPNNDGVLLRKDSIVVAPTWLAHRDQAAWKGVSPDQFHAERFLTTDPDTGKTVFSLAGSAGSLFPFGGGKTICPGRVFAKQEVLGSVAIVMSDFEIEGLGFTDRQGKPAKAFPGLGDAYPGSVTLAMNGDVKIKVKRRT